MPILWMAVEYKNRIYASHLIVSSFYSRAFVGEMFFFAFMAKTTIIFSFMTTFVANYKNLMDMSLSWK